MSRRSRRLYAGASRRVQRLQARKSVREANRQISAAKAVGRPTVVVNCESPSLWPFVSPILDALRKQDPTVLYVGAVRDVGAPPEPGIDVVFDTHGTGDIRGADLYLTPQIFGVAPPGAPLVLAPHNQVVRASHYPREQFAAVHTILVMGPVHHAQCERTKERYGLGRYPELTTVGYPKSDALQSGSYRRDAVLAELGLEPQRHTVVFAPAWEEHLSLREHGTRLFAVLRRIAEDSNVIVKLHPTSTLPPTHPSFARNTGGIDWSAALQPFLEHPRMRHVVTNDIDPLLAPADVMITDMSSVALEFLAMGRPVVYVDCPRFFELTLPHQYQRDGYGTADMQTVLADPLVNAGRHVGLGTADIDELPALVRQFRENPGLLHAERSRYAADLLCNRGVAAAAAAEQLLTFLRRDGHDLAAMPAAAR